MLKLQIESSGKAVLFPDAGCQESEDVNQEGDQWAQDMHFQHFQRSTDGCKDGAATAKERGTKQHEWDL